MVNRLRALLWQGCYEKLKEHGSSHAEWMLMLVAFVDAVGRGLFLAGATFFYTQVVNLSTTQVGVGLSLAGLVGLLCSLVIGRLAGRIGAGKTLIGLQIWRALGFFIYPFVDSYLGFLAVACFIGVVELAVWPTIQAVAGAVTSHSSQVKKISIIAIIRNVGYTLSAGVVALIIGFSGSKLAIQWLLVGNAIAFLISALVLLAAHLPNPAKQYQAAEEVLWKKPFPLKDRNFLLLSFFNGVLSLHAAAMNIALPLWILTKTDAPKFLVSILFAVNTILTVAFQLRFSRRGDELLYAARKQLYAGLSLAVFCIITAFTSLPNVWLVSSLLLLCTVILTFGELWQSAGAWGLSFGLSPVNDRAYYLNVYALGASSMSIIAPGLLSVVVVENGILGWLGFSVIFALSGIAVLCVAKKTVPTSEKSSNNVTVSS